MQPIDWNKVSTDDALRMKSIFNILYILADASELYNMELSSLLKKYGYLKYQDKQLIETAMKACKNVSKRVDTVCDRESATEFGTLSDELIELIDKYVKTFQYEV